MRKLIFVVIACLVCVPSIAVQPIDSKTALQTALGHHHDVKEFGARGDGVTNDTVAIQKAIDALPISGGVVFFPPGIYLVSQDVQVKKPNIKLLGMGSGVSTIKIGMFWNTPSFLGAVPAMVNLFGQRSAHISNIEIKGLHFIGSPNTDQNEPKCIFCLFADNVTLEGNLFENFGYECIWPAGGGITPSAHWRIINNHFKNIGVKLVAPSAVTINGDDFVVANNTFDNIQGGIGASARRAVITGNALKNVAQFGIAVAGDAPGADDIVVSNNQIEITAGPALRWGIGVFDGARNVVITANAIRVMTITEGPIAESAVGIRLQGPHEGALIQGNIILLDAIGALQEGRNLIGINGFDNGNTLDVVLANNVIRLINENTYYIAGINISLRRATEVVKAVLIGNVVKGFARSNSAYAFDLHKSASGTMTYTSIGNITDGGFIRFPDKYITDSSLDNVPIFNSVGSSSP